MAHQNLAELTRQIRLAGYSAAELNEIAEAIKFARTMLGREIKNSLGAGSKVSFTDSRTGIKYTGQVVKVAIKNVTVKTDQGPTYRVPATMLSLDA